MAQQIRQLLQINVLDELSTHKAQFILRSINQHNRHKFAHFDEEFVANLLKNPQVPELLKISLLTAREWQVLGLIYSGYSNEQISQELVVAITTIKRIFVIYIKKSVWRIVVKRLNIHAVY
ncbi:ATP-dependent transcriptional regulator [Actinobacillus pleuropneumoniae]|nr:ATP-dependent transcriptional regulator [Actinobacillus pleuropneumoniae]